MKRPEYDNVIQMLMAAVPLLQGYDIPLPALESPALLAVAVVGAVAATGQKIKARLETLRHALNSVHGRISEIEIDQRITAQAATNQSRKNSGINEWTDYYRPGMTEREIETVEKFLAEAKARYFKEDPPVASTEGEEVKGDG